MKYFKNAITSWEDWEIWILQPLENFYKLKSDTLPEFLDDTQSFYTQEQIYELFNENYANMIVRFNSKEDFSRNLRLVLKDRLPKLFVATLAFVNNEFQKLLIQANRGDIQTQTIGSLTKQKLKQGVPPSNLVMTSDLSDLNIKNAQYLENAIKDSHNSQFTNLLQNLKQIIQSNINGVILDWLKTFSFLFTSLLTDEFDWNRKLTDILYDLNKNMEEVNKNVADMDDKFQSLEDLVNSDNELEENLNAQVVKNTSNIATIQQDITDIQTNITSDKTELDEMDTTLQENIDAIKQYVIDNYVNINDSQVVNGAKYFTNGLILEQKENSDGNTTYSGYIQYRDSSNNVLENVGFVSGNDTKNGNMTYTFQKSKVINVPSYDTTNSNFGDNSLITKKYMSNVLANYDFSKGIDSYLTMYDDSTVEIANYYQFMVNAISGSNENQFMVNFTETTSSQPIKYVNVSNDLLDDTSLVPKSYVDNAVSLKYFTTTISTSAPFITSTNANGDITIVATVITFADNTYTDRDLAFIEDTLASEAKPRRHTVLQIGTDNSVCYIGGPSPDGGVDVGATIKVYYYE